MGVVLIVSVGLESAFQLRPYQHPWVFLVFVATIQCFVEPW